MLKRLSGMLILLVISTVLLGCNQSPGVSSTPDNGSTSGNGTTLNNDASISNITLSAGTLDQLVQGNQSSYTATVGFFVSSEQVTVEPTDSQASLSIDGSPVVPGVSTTIPLAVGSNTLTAVITSSDGSTTKTYTVDVTRQNQSQIQQVSATASNADIGDAFGDSVAISGNTMVVGATGESGDANSTASNPNNNAVDAGAVYVFTRSNGVWTQQAYIKASNPDDYDSFGTSVALSGDTLVVGANGESGDANSTASNPNNNAIDAGAVYVFTRSNGVWTQQAYLKASNAASDNEFGSSVAISGGSVVVGSYGEAGNTGSVYVFTSTNGVWTQQAYLKASNAEAFDWFGRSVAISGDTLVVGAPYESGDASSTAASPNNNASGAGAAYVFTRTNGVWTQQAYLKANNAAAYDDFGFSVALSGDTVVIGADGESGDASSTAASPNNNASGAGAAYVFTRTNGVWTQQAYLKASNAETSDEFAWSVAINGNGDMVTVGAEGESGDASSTVGSPNNNAPGAGAAYVFSYKNGVWTQLAYLKADNADIGDKFGWGVAIGGGTVVVGAPFNGTTGTSYVLQ